MYLNNSNRAFVSVEPAGEQHLSLNYAAISDHLRSAIASKSIDYMPLDAFTCKLSIITGSTSQTLQAVIFTTVNVLMTHSEQCCRPK